MAEIFKKDFEWTPLRFGKYAGYTLPQIVLSDSDYFFWAEERQIFQPPQDSEAADIFRLVRRIKIPKIDPENWRVKYKFSPDGKFVDFSVISLVEAWDAVVAHDFLDGGSNSQIRPFLVLDVPTRYADLEPPRSMKRYDKKCYDKLLSKFKKYYFNGQRLTREKCENFFYDSDNFFWVTDAELAEDRLNAIISCQESKPKRNHLRLVKSDRREIK